MTVYAGYGRFKPGELRTVSAEFIDRLMRECHNEAIEQCARMAESKGFFVTPKMIAAAIRALKGNP